MTDRRDLLAGRHVELKGCRELRRDELSDPVVRRFLTRLRRTPAGCCLWTGAVNADGYGIVRISSTRLVLAHRLAVALTLGTCPADRVVDHRCAIRSCCATAHLRLVSLEDNSPGMYGLVRAAFE